MENVEKHLGKPFSRENRVLKARQRGESVFGLFVYTESLAVIDMAGYYGLDFLLFDYLHAPYSWETLKHLVVRCELAGVTPMIRIRERSEAMVALDLGFQGIVFPHLRTKEDAILAARSIKYEPEGTRGACINVQQFQYGPTRTNWAALSNRAEKETTAVFMIEEKEAVDNIEDIVSIIPKGSRNISVMPGMFDLSHSMGLPPSDRYHPDVVKAWRKAIDISVNRGVDVMLHLPQVIAVEGVDPVKAIKKCQDKGVNLFTVEKDLDFLIRGYQELARITGECK